MQPNSSARNYIYKAVAITFFVFSLVVFNSMTANAQELKVTVDDITDNPSHFVGKTVTVRAEVEEVLSSNIAVIEDDEVFQEEMLVLSASPLSSIVLTPVKENDDATFTGVVHIFNATELQQELGLNFSEKMIKKYSGKPVLILGEPTKTAVSTTVVEEKKVELETPKAEPERQETSEAIETPTPQPQVESPPVAPEKPAKRIRAAKD
jgi:hypothetical protein